MILQRERNHTAKEKALHALGFLVLAVLMISVVVVRLALLACKYVYEQFCLLVVGYANTRRYRALGQHSRFEPPR